MKAQIWYHTNHGSLKAQEVMVARHTKDSVWLVEEAWFHGDEDVLRKQKRHSLYDDYWESQSEAIEHLLQKARKQHDCASEDLRRADECLAIINEGGFPVRKYETKQKINKQELLKKI